MVQWFSILVSKTNDEGSNPSKPALVRRVKKRGLYNFKKRQRFWVIG